MQSGRMMPGQGGDAMLATAATEGNRTDLHDVDQSGYFKSSIYEFLRPENPDRTMQRIVEQLRINELCSPSMRPNASSEPPYLSALKSQVRRELSTLPPNERASVCYGARESSQAINALAMTSERVGTMVKGNYYQGAEQEQRNAVEHSDKIHSAPLMMQLRSLDRAIEQERDENVRVRLVESRDAVRSSIAAPFTERARLAALQMDLNQLHDAEQTIDSALKLDLPGIVFETPYMKELRTKMEAQRKFLETTRIMPSFVETNHGTFDKSKDGFLNKQELTDARSTTSSPLELRIINYMIDNYDTLRNMHDDGWFTARKGVSLADIRAYQNKTRPHEFM